MGLKQLPKPLEIRGEVGPVFRGHARLRPPFRGRPILDLDGSSAPCMGDCSRSFTRSARRKSVGNRSPV
jgi:hypothetical protein